MRGVFRFRCSPTNNRAHFSGERDRAVRGQKARQTSKGATRGGGRVFKTFEVPMHRLLRLFGDQSHLANLNHGRIGLAGLLAATLALAGCDDNASQATANAPPPPQVSVSKPVVKEFMEWDDFTGRFEAVDQVDVRARVSGYLQKIHFKEGSLIKEGDLLFTIDRRPFQAALSQADSSVNIAKTKLDFATQEFKRAEDLVKSGTVSISTLDERRQAYLSAQAELAGAESALRTARLNLDYTTIYSPISGRISRKNISVGNLVVANETVLTNIVSLDPIHFYFDVDERSYLAYARMARQGTRASGRITPHEVRVTLTDEREGTRTGKLDFVDNRIDSATGTMRGRAIFDNQDLILQPGLFGRLSLPGSPLYKGILIPDEAIGSDQNRRIVYVVGEDNVVAPKVIRPGPKIDGYRVVRNGLTGEETLVVGGLIRVRPGVKITPKPIELPLTRE